MQIPEPGLPSIVSEMVKIPSGEYKLNGELSYPDSGTPKFAVVISCPHPLLGGNMENNVIKGLGNGLASKGMLTLRFDYRGVGKSEGPSIDLAKHLAEFWETSHVPDELNYWQDLQASVNFLKDIDPTLPIALVGYSFGCSLLPLVQAGNRISCYVLIAPTLKNHDYFSYRSVHEPILVIASNYDFFTSQKDIENWIQSLSGPRYLLTKDCDNHFFRGHENWVIDKAFGFIQSNCGNRS